ncbi:hypothetical protein Plhal304r1_c001g0002531 [Plasmopara halstedii]
MNFILMLWNFDLDMLYIGNYPICGYCNLHHLVISKFVAIISLSVAPFLLFILSLTFVSAYSVELIQDIT